MAKSEYKSVDKTEELKNIGDADNGAKVIMHVFGSNGNKLDFETEVVKEDVNNPGVLSNITVTALRHDGKLLNFNGVKVIAEVAIGSLVYSYNIDSIEVVSVNNTKYHSLNCTKQSKGKNRRENVRVTLVVGAVAQLDLNRQAVECNTRDLSVSGISLIFDGERKVTVGATMHITFSYDNEQFKVAATVVRGEYDIEKNRTIVGLHFNTESDAIRAVVMQLQRKELEKLRRKHE